MAQKLSAAERERRHKAAQRAAVVGAVEAAKEFRLPHYAVYNAMGELGLRSARPLHNRETRRLIAEESAETGIDSAAAKYGVSSNTVRCWRREFGAGGGRLSRTGVIQIVAALRRGLKHKTIARRHGTSVGTISVIARECRAEGLLD